MSILITNQANSHHDLLECVVHRLTAVSLCCGRSAFFPLLFLMSLLCPAASAQGFTIDQILGAPFPYEMSASPSGERLAWVMNERGARNIWVAESPDFAARRLTAWEEDDGMTVSSLDWTPDSDHILFVRGTSQNSKGEYPNPLHLPEGTDQSIWSVDFSEGKTARLAEGAAPLASSDGKSVLFLKQGQVWHCLLDGSKEPELLVKARGSSSSLSWSPDGKLLAFVSRRGDHSFIGIYSVSEKSVRFLDPSVDLDVEPVWSPLGDEIAFVRIPASRQLYIFAPHRTAQPWSIRIANVSTGEGRQFWQADPGKGSAPWETVSRSQLFWSRDGYLVFPWEKDGWNHLYSIPVGGGEPTLLTPGDFEVEQVVPGPEGTDLYFNSNQGDIDRRHLWRVRAQGGPPEALTQGNSNEWDPAPLEGGVAFIGSSGTSPAQPRIQLPGSPPRILAPDSLPADFPESSLVEPQQVVFPAADGKEIHGQLFLPRNSGPGQKHPAVLYFHGGSRRQMLLGWHYSEYYHNCYALNQYLASQGFIVLSVNYRSGIGYGMEFREALNYGAAGASEFHDVLGAGLYLRSRSDVNPDGIGLWGGSYGGYLTALGLARASDLFAAGVDVHGVHDWNVVIQNFVPTYDPQEREVMARLAFESSPMASVQDWKSPVLLIHGDDDRNVPFSESVDLAESLRKQGVHLEQLVFPDEVHGFLLYRSWKRAFETAANFLRRHLATD